MSNFSNVRINLLQIELMFLIINFRNSTNGNGNKMVIQQRLLRKKLFSLKNSSGPFSRTSKSKVTFRSIFRKRVVIKKYFLHFLHKFTD